MAHAVGDAHQFPIRGAHYLLTFPILDADGDLVTGASTPDTEVSKDLGTFADCTNEFTEIATASGTYYIYLTGAEMTADVVCVIAKSATAGAKTTPMFLYPQNMPVHESDTAEGGGNTSITLAVATAASNDDAYNGMYVLTTNNDPAGVQYQARLITDYDGTTRAATVKSAWGTNPTSATTYSILAGDALRVSKDGLKSSSIAANAIGSSEMASTAINEIADAVLTRVNTEGYPTDGVMPTLEQFIAIVQAALLERNVSSTTVTYKKLNGSTTAFTATLNDAVNPTSITKAS